MKVKYSNIIYCYDIETSQVIHNAEHYQSTYLHGLSSVIYRPLGHVPFEDFESETHYECYRTYDDISQRFKALNDRAKDEGKTIKIFVHNLSYEFEAMMRNIKFCINNFKEDKFIAVATHQPMLVTCGNLEFYDSFKLLSCKGLETIGSELGVPKLKDVKGGYNQRYYWWSKLPESEYIYNKRDCNLVLYAVCRYMNNYNNVSKVNDIGISSTSMIKRESRLNRDISTEQEVRAAQQRAKKELETNEPFIKIMQEAFAGGYTHANPYAVGKHFKDVYCFDASSMHPSAMYGRIYPYDWRVTDNAQFNELHGRNLRDILRITYDYRQEPVSSDSNERLFRQPAINNDSILEIARTEALRFERPYKNYFIGRVTYNSIKVRDFGNCTYAYISVSKCKDISKAVYDNGKLAQAEHLTFVGCDIDFMLIDMLYTYDTAECIELISASKRGRLSKTLRNTVKYYARQKTGFKKLEKKVADHVETLNDFTFEGLELYQTDVAEEIMETHNKDLVHFALTASKGGLNGQYGCSAMKPMRAEVGVQGGGEDFEWVDLGDVFLKNGKSLNIFTDGLYTVGYSRLHLISFALYLVLKHGITPLYHDTDSVYFTGYNDEVHKSIDQFNKDILNNSENGDCYNFGIMDFDGHYEDFCTWGSKCYCATCKDSDGNLKVKATVAGASKKQLSQLFTNIVNDYDFDYLMEEYFHPDISYDETINKKLIRKTPGTHFKGRFTDENGEVGELDECSVTVLEPCGYTLRSTANPVVNKYYEYCYRLQGRRFYRDEPMTVSVKDNDFTRYTKKSDLRQWDFVEDVNPADIFLLQHNRRKQKCEI